MLRESGNYRDWVKWGRAKNTAGGRKQANREVGHMIDKIHNEVESFKERLKKGDARAQLQARLGKKK